jgi:hypothetical protein
MTIIRNDTVTVTSVQTVADHDGRKCTLSPGCRLRVVAAGVRTVTVCDDKRGLRLVLPAEKVVRA